MEEIDDDAPGIGIGTGERRWGTFDSAAVAAMVAAATTNGRRTIGPDDWTAVWTMTMTDRNQVLESKRPTSVFGDVSSQRDAGEKAGQRSRGVRSVGQYPRWARRRGWDPPDPPNRNRTFGKA